MKSITWDVIPFIQRGRYGGLVSTRTGAGPLLRQWRTRRRFSQLQLAAEAGVSQRHLSFLETGRARPSREMLLHLGEVLDVPLRDRNTMLSAAGFAPVYRERSLDDPDMAAVRRAVELLIERHDPYPAFAIDRHWKRGDDVGGDRPDDGDAGGSGERADRRRAERHAPDLAPGWPTTVDRQLGRGRLDAGGSGPS